MKSQWFNCIFSESPGILYHNLWAFSVRPEYSKNKSSYTIARGRKLYKVHFPRGSSLLSGSNFIFLKMYVPYAVQYKVYRNLKTKAKHFQQNSWNRLVLGLWFESFFFFLLWKIFWRKILRRAVNWRVRWQRGRSIKQDNDS